MGFQQGLVTFMHSNLLDWNARVNVDGDVVIIMRNSKPHGGAALHCGKGAHDRHE